MSVRIVLDNAPEFYTNLDFVEGRVILTLTRPEQISAIVVKLEGEAKTALVPELDAHRGESLGGPMATENHKILYRVQQIFQDDRATSPLSAGAPLRPGVHQFPFRFKIPFNNACSDVVAMSKMGGLGGVGGFGAAAGGFFGSGIRMMDGTRQAFLFHVKKTLPPSLTGFPGKAEIRYYVKATIQRPGLLRENWRNQLGFRFMPVEPPRPPKSPAKAFAKRPFAFRQLSPAQVERRKSSFFGRPKQDGGASLTDLLPPSVEMCAWLPHPLVLTCNTPIPLQLEATKKLPSTQPVFLTGLQVDLVGTTKIRCYDMVTTVPSRFIVVLKNDLHIPLTRNADDPVGTKVPVPDILWRGVPLPNTVCPSFVACNLMREYHLELKLTLSWPPTAAGKPGHSHSHAPPQSIVLPLHFQDVQVFSGIAPPPEILDAALGRPLAGGADLPPRLPPRTNSGKSMMQPPAVERPNMGPGQPASPTAATTAGPSGAAPGYDPLYPPQVGAAGSAAYDDAPPSYDEAMSVDATGPVARPAFSGVATDLDGPSQIPDKSG